MEIKVPYGKEEINITLTDERLLDIVHPNEVKVRNAAETILEAVDNPVGSKKFDDFLQGADEVLFIVNDGTRPTPTAEVLKVLYPRLKNIKPKFIVATGCHRGPTEDEYEFMFGSLYNEYKNDIHVHDARRDEDMVHIGTSKAGTEMYVNKIGVQAEKIVVVGSVEPHYFGGYTGGRKAFLPGIASYRTIEQNHKYAIRPEPKALLLDGNPVHEDMIDAIKTIEDKDVFSIQTVLDRDRKIYAVTAGDIHRSFDAAIKYANDVFCVEVAEKADIVVTVAPYPMDVDLYQSQKALDNGKLALKDGGIMILVSRCRQGVGERSFFDLLGSCDTPQQTLDLISGEYKLGFHKAAKLAEIAVWAQMWAVTDLADEDVSSAFMKPFGSIQDALDAALAEKGADAKVLFMMDGSITVPMIAQ